VLLFKDYAEAYLAAQILPVIIPSLASEIGPKSFATNKKNHCRRFAGYIHPPSLIVMTSYLKHRMNDPAIVSVCYDYTVSRADIRNIATFFRLFHQKRHLMEKASWMGCGWASIARQYEPRI
jgi:hypothetical protein